MGKKKICIYVPAYNVESTLSLVIDRIPAKLRRKAEEILIIDNASRDNTYMTAVRYKKKNDLSNMTIIKNQRNLGYGGSQKKAYQHAIEKGYDAVAMLHGDAQYAPEKTTFLLEPILERKADMVFGSRIRGDPLKGGMPFWKLMGNQFLTGLENRILGLNLSEFHSGFRVYSCDALKQVPFRLCSDAYLFDTDIIIQFVIKDMRIKEVPIPTYYGEGAKNIPLGELTRYSFGILGALTKYVLHKYGIRRVEKFSI